MLEAALRDALVAGYDGARAGEPDAAPLDKELRAPLYDLVRLALLVTADVVA